MYNKNQVYFQYMHFIKSENFILENPGNTKPSWHPYSALGKEKAWLLKIAEYLLPKKGDIHLRKIPPCTQHTLAFSFISSRQKCQTLLRHWSRVHQGDSSFS